MITHNLIQGSAEWLAYRASYFNASDAPAMLGHSTYKSRTQLLHELATGLTPEVDAATQRRFDAGHRFEALARPLAEEFIGQDLYPVVGSKGKLSASFDGLTMAEDIVFEHKTLNDSLRTIMVEGCTGANLGKQYQIQMEQQLMVSGANRALFMASSWASQEDELIEERHCWYESNPTLRAEILQGWTQFAVDLAAYVPPAAVIEAVGHTPETLPALRIEVTGMVTASNLAQYKEHAMAVFAGINRELTTDQHFADADKIVKWCGDVEDRLAAAKQHALSQTESIDVLFRTIDDISAEARRTRLELDKLIKARKEQVRLDILQEGAAALREHIVALNTRLGNSYLPSMTVDFAGVMKGKRTVDSLRDAMGTTLTNAKIAVSATADRIQINLMALRELAPGFSFLFADAATILLKANDDFLVLVKSRIADHTAAEAAKEEATRARIRAEEVARLAREQADLDRATAEKAAAELKAASVVEAMKLVMQAPPLGTAVKSIPPASEVCEIVQLDTFSKLPPELRLGQMADRLGFALTAAFLSELGFEPAATERASKLYHESDFPLICAALVSHIHMVAHIHSARQLQSA